MLFPTPTEYVPPSPHSFIAEGVTKGLGAVEEQRKELCGMSASCCIPKFSARPYGRVYLHNWLNCFSPTHIHPFTDASCLLRPRSRIACWKTACLGFSVAAPNAIRQHSLSSRRQQYFGLFPGRALSPGGREEPQCPCPHHGSGQRSVRLHSGLLPAPWGLAGHLLSRFSLWPPTCTSSFPVLPYQWLCGLYVVLSRQRRTARSSSLSFASLPTPTAAVLAVLGAVRRRAPRQREARAKSTQPPTPPSRPEAGTRAEGGEARKNSL